MKGLVLSAAVFMAALGTLAGAGASDDRRVVRGVVNPQGADVDMHIPTHDGHVLAGTLSLPSGRGPHLAVVLVSGAGPHDRDGSVAGHAPFMLIADTLRARGVAVLRLDDRGVGESGGKTEDTTIAMRVEDGRRAIAHLRARSDIARVGIVGHSEGATVAALIASEQDVAFVVALGGPGVSGRELAPRQVASVLDATGAYPRPVVETLVAAQRRIVTVVGDGGDRPAVEAAVHAGLSTLNALRPPDQRRSTGEIAADAARDGAVVASPWFRSYITTDPRSAWRGVRCPVLALHGSRDTQVPTGSEIRVGEHHELPGLNHLLQPAVTGLVDEYGAIEEAIDADALERIVAFVAARGVSVK